MKTKVVTLLLIASISFLSFGCQKGLTATSENHLPFTPSTLPTAELAVESEPKGVSSSEMLEASSREPSSRAPEGKPLPSRKEGAKVIALDAGHGPGYPGAVHRDATDRVDLVEKDLNLEVALLLAELLRNQGYDVVLIREDDYLLTPFAEGDLTTRVRREQQARADAANQAQADILISIHFNGFEDPDISGTETYYCAARPFAEKSRALAERVQAGILAQMGAQGYNPANRGVKDDFHIGRRFDQEHSFLLGSNLERPTTMPGIFGEALFLTNHREAELLKQPQTLSAIARGYLAGINEYFAGGEAQKEKAITQPLRVSVEEVERGNPNRFQVALSFDAGASAEPLPQILDALKKHKLHSTFFVTGQWAEANSSLLRQIAAEGHELGNHSYSHPHFTELTAQGMTEELEKTEEIVRRITGKSTKPLFRPPFGDRDDRVRRVVADAGYRTIYWTIDSTDWLPEATPESVLRRVSSNASNGAIFVLHVGSWATAQTLEEIISELEQKGFAIVTVSQVIAS